MSIDILELIENLDLLTFHYQTLNLYCKLTAHGNQKVAHILCTHIDEDQLIYAVKSHCMFFKINFLSIINNFLRFIRINASRLSQFFNSCTF